MPAQPGEGPADKGRTIFRWQISMRNEYPFDWPDENFVERGPRRATVQETRTPITRYAWIGSDDPAMPREEPAPSLEPVIEP